MSELDRKASSVFAGKVVRKDLVRKIKVGANVPAALVRRLEVLLVLREPQVAGGGELTESPSELLHHHERVLEGARLPVANRTPGATDTAAHEQPREHEQTREPGNDGSAGSAKTWHETLDTIKKEEHGVQA